MNQWENGIEIIYTIYRGNRNETKEYPASILLSSLREFCKEHPNVENEYLSFILSDLPKYVQNALFIRSNGPHSSFDDVDLGIARIIDLISCDEELQYYNAESERIYLEKVAQSNLEIEACMKHAPYPIEN